MHWCRNVLTNEKDQYRLTVNSCIPDMWFIQIHFTICWLSLILHLPDQASYIHKFHLTNANTTGVTGHGGWMSSLTDCMYCSYRNKHNWTWQIVEPPASCSHIVRVVTSTLILWPRTREPVSSLMATSASSSLAMCCKQNKHLVRTCGGWGA